MTSGASPALSSPPTVSHRRADIRALVSLAAAAVLFLVFSYLAFRREPWPGAFGTRFSHRWFSTVFTGVPSKLPAYNVRFNAVTTLPGTDTFIAVGTGGAVMPSKDGGKTWGPIRWTGSAAEHLSDVSFADTRIGWAVGTDGVILRSEDGGETWTHQVSPNSFDLESVHAISPARAIAVGQAGTIIATDDGGQSWQTRSSIGVVRILESVDFATPQAGLIAGNDGVILRTQDGGNTWERVESGSQMGINCIRFANPDVAWAAGNLGTILRSTDQGRTWSKTETNTERNLYGIKPLNPEHAIAVGSNTIGITNDGVKWSLTVNPLNSRLTSIAVSASGARAAVGFAGSILVASSGADWKPKSIGAVGILYDVASTREGTWVPGNDGQLLLSNGAGRPFLTTAFKPEASWGRITFSPDNMHGLVIGLDGELLKTGNAGRSWQEMSGLKSPSPRLIDAAMADESHAWLAGVRLWRTRDGGMTWDIPDAAPTYPASVAFADALRGIVMQYPGAVYFTEDGGDNWQRASVEPESMVHFAANRIRYLDRNHVWAVGTHGIVLRSDDGGHSWKAFDSAQHTEFSDIQFLSDQKHGWIVGLDGIWGATSDGGATWAFNRIRDHVLMAVDYRDVDHGTIVGWGGKIIQTSDGGRNWVDYEPSWWPSPWYYPSWLLVALVAAPAFRRPPPRRAGDATIANKLVSDRPLEPGEQDAFGLWKVAQGLSRFLRNENTVPPLTVAITGEWGSGKSSLMNLLASDLRTNGFRPVFFNAWHAQKEESVLASIFEAIRKRGLPSISTVEGLLFRATLLFRRCLRHWLSMSLLAAFLAASAGLLEARPSWLAELWTSFMRNAPAFLQTVASRPGKDAPAWLGFAASAITLAGLIGKSLKAFGVKPQEILAYNTTEGAKRRPYHLRFAEQFHDVAAALAPRRMVIFVDDLDRCRPQYVLDTLEAINFLVSSGECFVVMGLAPEQVKAAIGLAFKDIAEEMTSLESEEPAADANIKDDESRRRREEFARHYLYKLINMEIPVPEVGHEGATNVLAGKGVETSRPRGVLHALRPYAAVLAVCTLLCGSFLLAQRVASIIQSASDARLARQDKTGSMRTAPAKPEEPRATPDVQATGAVITPETAPIAVMKGHAPVTVPVSTLNAHPVRYLVAAPLVFLWIASLVWILRVRISLVVRDSANFTRAVEVWEPVLSQTFHTPRALKRFLNKVRYLAMLQRADPPEPTVWAAVARTLRRGESAEPLTSGSLSESALVGFAAMDEALGVATVDSIARCRQTHAGEFGDLLDDGQHREYLRLTQGLKVR